MCPSDSSVLVTDKLWSTIYLLSEVLLEYRHSHVSTIILPFYLRICVCVLVGTHVSDRIRLIPTLLTGCSLLAA